MATKRPTTTPTTKATKAAPKPKTTTKATAKATTPKPKTTTKATPKSKAIKPQVEALLDPPPMVAAPKPRLLKSEHIRHIPGVVSEYTTRVAIEIDVSGSMLPHMYAVIQAYNRLLDSLAEKALRFDQSIVVSLSVFSLDRKLIYTNRPVHLAPRLHEAALTPGGATSLYLAMAKGAETLDTPIGVSEDVANLVIVLTDGHNTERLLPGAFRELIDYMRSPTYTFAVFTDNPQAFVSKFVQDARGQGTPPSVREDEIEAITGSWQPGAVGARMWAEQVSTSMDAYLTARAKGERKVKSFTHKVDLDSRTIPWTKMTPMAVMHTVVDRDTPLPEFAQCMLDPTSNVYCKVYGNPKATIPHKFTKGMGFYELTPDQGTVTVQPYKQVILEDLSVGGRSIRHRFFGGPKAREALGIADASGNVKVKAGDLQDVRVYVQSTSTNRKLLKGAHFVLNLGSFN
jgi:Mg-chelatase subunit ChlD